MSDIVDRILDLMQSRGLMADEDDAKRVIAAVLDAIASDGDLIISVARQRARDERYDPDFMMRDLTGPEYAAWTTFVDDVRDVFAALRKEIEDV